MASLLACKIAPNDPRFRAMHDKVRLWTWEHFPDRTDGEWFGYLSRDGRPTTDLKGNLFKARAFFPCAARRETHSLTRLFPRVRSTSRECCICAGSWRANNERFTPQ